MTEPPAPLLAVRAAAKTYGAVVALRSADLSVAPGEIHALLGANGAGKSTLVKILSGVIRPDSGSIAVTGREVRFNAPGDARRDGLAAVFQDPALVPDLTVAENLRLTGVEADAIAPWVEQMGLAGVDLDDIVRDLPLPLLRMLDLARALALDPLVLMLDEMTAALPADMAERVFALMQAWKARGRSVLFITHRLNEVMRTCDMATVLRDGRTVAVLSSADFGGWEAHATAGEGALGTSQSDPGGHRRLVAAMLGEVAVASGEIAALPSAVRTDATPALEAIDVHAGSKLHGVSFAVRPGEILGIAGLEGQGQDVLFQVLSGEKRPRTGSLEVEGKPLHARSPYDAIRRGVVLVPSDRLLALLPQRSVAENIATPLYNRPRRWSLIDADEEESRVRSAVERLSIDIRAQKQVRRLSGGNQQKVTIGRWLAAGFRTLLCFDPTRGIDIGTKSQIYRLLRELAAEGAAVVLYTSELAEIPLVCDRVLVMYDGRFVHEQEAATADEATLLTASHGLQEVPS